jgi:hypothetical protein
VRELDYFSPPVVIMVQVCMFLHPSISLKDESVINNLMKIRVLWDSLLFFSPCFRSLSASSLSFRQNLAGCFLSLIVVPDNAVSMFLRNVCDLLHPRSYKFRNVYVNGVKQTNSLKIEMKNLNFLVE